jgi:hypothetical protein
MKDEVKDMIEYKLNKIKYMVRIQSHFRKYRIYKVIQKVVKARKRAAILIQSAYRGCVTRMFVQQLKLCVKIQRFFRKKKNESQN